MLCRALGDRDPVGLLVMLLVPHPLQKQGSQVSGHLTTGSGVASSHRKPRDRHGPGERGEAWDSKDTLSSFLEMSWGEGCGPVTA